MEILRKAQTAAHLYTADSIFVLKFNTRSHLTGAKTLYFFLTTCVLLWLFYFILSLHFTPCLQSAVCVWHWPPVNPHFTQRSTRSRPLGCYATLRHLIFLAGITRRSQNEVNILQRSQHFIAKSTFHHSVKWKDFNHFITVLIFKNRNKLEYSLSRFDIAFKCSYFKHEKEWTSLFDIVLYNWKFIS